MNTLAVNGTKKENREAGHTILPRRNRGILKAWRLFQQGLLLSAVPVAAHITGRTMLPGLAWNDPYIFAMTMVAGTFAAALILVNGRPKYKENSISNNLSRANDLIRYTKIDTDLITDTDWLYLITDPKAWRLDNPRVLLTPNWALIRQVLTPGRLGRIDKHVLAQMLAKCPDKETRLHITTQLAQLAAHA